MLNIKNLTVGTNNKVILKKINLHVKKGEFHVIMGRNGTGKSTLSNFIAGKEGYVKKSGDIFYNKTNINNFLPEERAAKESPFKSTVAHGFMSVAMISKMLEGMFSVEIL